jgi:hypothetical protein
MSAKILLLCTEQFRSMKGVCALWTEKLRRTNGMAMLTRLQKLRSVKKRKRIQINVKF